MSAKDWIAAVGLGLLVVLGVVFAVMGEFVWLGIVVVLLAGLIGALLIGQRLVNRTLQIRHLETQRRQSALREQIKDLHGVVHTLGVTLENQHHNVLAQNTALNEAQHQNAETLEDLARQLEDITARVKAVGKQTYQSHSAISAVHQRVEYSRGEVESYMQVMDRLQPRRLMPPLGGWPLDATSAVYLLDLLEKYQPRRIVELGSGSTTTILARYAQQMRETHPDTPVEFYSFDHLDKYLDLTVKYLQHHELEDFADVQLAPLTTQEFSGETFSWYDLSNARLPQDGIDLLLVDGPPAKTGPQARYPAVAALWDQLNPGALVLLDDGVRDEEQAIADRWAEQFPGLVRQMPDLTAMIVLEKTAEK